MKTTIYLVRHAEAEGNLCRRIHGHYNSNLTARGLRQLKLLRQRFRELPVDACWSSDLMRAQNTAQAVCQARGLENHPDPRFREIGIGIWEDRSFGYLTTFHGEQLVQFRQNRREWSVPGCESYSQYTDRFLTGMEELARAYSGGSIAIVSHSVVLSAVLEKLFPDQEIPHSANTAVTCLQYENGRYEMVFLNDFSHLSAQERTPVGAQSGDVLWCKTSRDGTYFALRNLDIVGALALSGNRLVHMELLPQAQGSGLSVQLLGKAISVLRDRGFSELRLNPGDCPAMEALCGKLPFVGGENGEWALNLSPRIQSF